MNRRLFFQRSAALVAGVALTRYVPKWLVEQRESGIWLMVYDGYGTLVSRWPLVWKCYAAGGWRIEVDDYASDYGSKKQLEVKPVSWSVT